MGPKLFNTQSFEVAGRTARSPAAPRDRWPHREEKTEGGTPEGSPTLSNPYPAKMVPVDIHADCELAPRVVTIFGW